MYTWHEKPLFCGDFSEFKEFHGKSRIPRKNPQPRNRGLLEVQLVTEAHDILRFFTCVGDADGAEKSKTDKMEVSLCKFGERARISP